MYENIKKEIQNCAKFVLNFEPFAEKAPMSSQKKPFPEQQVYNYILYTTFQRLK